jgi:hypothetical protein
MAFACYVLFAGVLSKLATLVRELDPRLDERTAALEREAETGEREDRERAYFLAANARLMCRGACVDVCGPSNDRSNGFGPTPWIV